MTRKQSRALQWFGSDASVSRDYAALLSNCKHVTVPFCGGLSIVAHLVETASEIVCNDKHRLAINLYQCLSDASLRQRLLSWLDQTPFHQEVLRMAQAACKRVVAIEPPDVEFAHHYFITNWMGRGGKGGSTGEFSGDLPVRWTASGGSSPRRFNTAIRSIQDYWGPICERCSFICVDWLEILNKVKDVDGNGIYIDPPWFGAGDEYVHKFQDPQEHTRLRNELLRFTKATVVIRYGDDESVRRLYSGTGWTIDEISSRDQANGNVKELCITRTI